MTRRQLAQRSLAFALGLAQGRGQERYPGTQYRDYGKCLPDYLEAVASVYREQRAAELASLQYVNKVLVRQNFVRRSARQLVGALPERTDLEVRTTGAEKRSGYRLEKLVFQSRPGLFVTANLYLPDRSGRLPAVLFQCGHAAEGKAFAEYQRCCQALAKLGCVVLCFDPVGQGERIFYPGNDPHRTRLGDPIHEHFRLGQQLLLWDETIVGTMAWDAIRGLDVLADHPSVDSRRIGVTGHSGGATMSLWLLSLDSRPSAAVLACGAVENATLPGFVSPGPFNDAEQNPVGGPQMGVDRWDLLLPFAPKPLLILVSATDNGGNYSPTYLKTAWNEFETLRSCYRLMNAEAQIGWGDTPLPHPLSLSLRTQLHDWFARHLQFDPPPAKSEPPTEPESEKALWATPDGSVLSLAGNRAPLAIRKSQPIAPSGTWAEALGVELPKTAPEFHVVATAPGDGYEVDAAEVPVNAQVYAPLWYFRPARVRSDAPVVVVIDESSRAHESGEGQLCARLAKQGVPVVSLDVRGIGDLTPDMPAGPRNWVGFRQSELMYAWGAISLGRPLLGQRVTDLVAVVRAMRARPELGSRSIMVFARAAMVPVAVLARPWLPEETGFALHGGLVSFASLGQSDEPAQTFGNYVRGALKLPDLPAVCAGARVALGGAVDGSGVAVPVDEVRALYSRSKLLAISSDRQWMESLVSR